MVKALGLIVSGSNRPSQNMLGLGRAVPPVWTSIYIQREPKRNRRGHAGTCDIPMSPVAGDVPDLSVLVRARNNAFQEKIERRRSRGRDALMAGRRRAEGGGVLHEPPRRAQDVRGLLRRTQQPA
jgi:hypothetical protein